MTDDRRTRPRDFAHNRRVRCLDRRQHHGWTRILFCPVGLLLRKLL